MRCKSLFLIGIKGSVKNRIDLIHADPLLPFTFLTLPPDLIFCPCILLILRSRTRIQHTFHMHIFRHFVPFHIKTGAMTAKNRAGRICHILLRVITVLLDHLLCIVTRSIAAGHTGKMTFSLCICCKLSGIIPKCRNRSSPL